MHIDMHNVYDESFDDFYTAVSYMIWCKQIKTLSKSEIAEKVLSQKNKYHAYFYCLKFKYKSKKVEKIILDSKDPKFAFLFYRDVNCDKSLMRKILFESNSSKYLSKMAELNSSYFKKAKKVVLNNQDEQSAISLLRINKDSKLINMVIKSKKPKYVYNLYKIIGYSKKIEDKLIELGNIKYLAYFAKDKKSNLEKIENFVRMSNKQKDILFFAEKVERSKLHELLIFS